MKQIAVKAVGGQRATVTEVIAPGTTTRDLLRKIGLDGGGFEISDNTGVRIFDIDEVIYPLVQDGDLLHVSACVDAGKVAA